MNDQKTKDGRKLYDCSNYDFFFIILQNIQSILSPIGLLVPLVAMIVLLLNFVLMSMNIATTNQQFSARSAPALHTLYML